MSDTLDNIWQSTVQKPIAIISDQGKTVLIQTQAANGWYSGKLMAEVNGLYLMDSTMILIHGDESIWQCL